MKFNKKASEEVLEEWIFVLLNILFFAILLTFIVKSAGANAITEEVYAKKIALTIDSMKPGTEVRLSLRYLFDRARANDYPLDKVIIFNDEIKTVRVQTRDSGGFSMNYFSDFNYQEVMQTPSENLVVLKMTNAK